MTSPYRALPSVDALLRLPALQAREAVGEHERLVRSIRRVLAEARSEIAQGNNRPTDQTLVTRVLRRLDSDRASHLRFVINASGVILQTNLGRAPLSATALEAMEQVATSYSNLEFDLAIGERGSRQTAIGPLIAAVSGAEAGLAVNNNAAAVLLALAALATGREVLVSRSQLVEIGGGFRIPEVLAQSGARLVEVGTTNRTYVGDYLAAITPSTAAILRVHPSNFVLRGFTHQPELEELAELSHQHDLVMIDDVGSGALLETAAFGLAHEPMVQESLRAGADVVCFSGDKLTGGPQAGIIAGQAALLQSLARHPLARAVRIDKLSLAALEATLRHYLAGDAPLTLPVWQMIGRQPDHLAGQAARWVEQLRAAGIPAETMPDTSTVGGGSLPGETLPTTLVALRISHSDAFARRLRLGAPAVVGRLHRDRFCLDPRTVLFQQEAPLLDRVLAAWHENDEAIATTETG